MRRIHSFHSAFTTVFVLAILSFATISAATKAESSTEPSVTAHPLLSAESLQVVSSFDAKKVGDQANWKWFCYEPGNAVLSNRPVETSKLGFKREPMDGPVILLFDSDSGTLYWKWQLAPPAKLFEDKDEVNLGEICFGLDPMVEKLWIRFNPDWDHRFKISSRLLSTEVYGGDVTLLEKAMEWIQDEWVDNKLPEFAKHRSEYDWQTNRLTNIAFEIETIDKRMPYLLTELKTAEDYDRQMRSSGRIEYSGAVPYTSPRTRTLRTERANLSAKRSKLKEEFNSLLELNKKTEAALIGLISSYKKSREKAPLEAAVRKMDFTVSVVMKGEERK